MPVTSHAARLQAAMQIHREIIAGKFPNATALGKLLGVSAKTARSYVALMADIFGVNPLYDEFRHGYYYEQVPRAPLIPTLREDEVAAVFLIEQAARDLAGSPIQKVLESVLSKLALMLPTNCNVTLDDIGGALSLRLDRGASLEHRDQETLTTLYGALLKKRSVSIQYEAPGHKDPSRRIIDPIHLTRCEGQWYLLAYCHLRKDMRTFVPARMKNVRVLSQSFERPAHFDPREHFRSAFGIAAGKDVREVALRFDASIAVLIRERQWHPTQQFSALADGSLRMTLTCSQGAELQAWILSWGEQAVVEKPAELIQKIHDRHRAAAERHNSCVTALASDRHL
jgi:predicted DNA-binding transcriptional regulator YafY